MKISNPFQKNYRFILGIIFTVLEGLSYGIPVIVSNRRCIC